MSVVLLGIGAAKAGTSWLHAQLAAHPGCHMRSIKELHYFDALDGGRLGQELRRHRDQQQAMLTRLAEAGLQPTDEQARRIADRADWLDVLERRREDEGAYLAYLRKGADGARVVGDLTPAYALLSESRLARLARLAEDVRFLFLMRDPVERLWSHVRMIAGRRDPQGRVTERRCARILARVFSGEEDQIARRSDYGNVLAKLAACVPERQVLIEVFEDMVAGPGFRRICDFLGLAPMRPSPAPVHAGQPLAMTVDQRQAAAAWLAPQYEAAERALGAMPGAWGRKG